MAGDQKPTKILILNDSEKKDILLSFLNKYSADHLKAGRNSIKKYWDDTQVIKMSIEHLSAKAHE